MLKNFFAKWLGANGEISRSQATVWLMGFAMAWLNKQGIWDWIPGDVQPDVENVLGFGIAAAVAYLYRRIYLALTGNSPATEV